MALNTMAASPGDRVPAWKKIGLRLKNASETVPEVKSTPTKQSNGLSQNGFDHDSHSKSPVQTSATLAIRSPDTKSKNNDISKRSKKRKASEVGDAAAIVSSEALGDASVEAPDDQAKE